MSAYLQVTSLAVDGSPTTAVYNGRYYLTSNPDGDIPPGTWARNGTDTYPNYVLQNLPIFYGEGNMQYCWFLKLLDSLDETIIFRADDENVSQPYETTWSDSLSITYSDGLSFGSIGRYIGDVAGLIQLPEDSLSLAPSGLISLSRKYACAKTLTPTIPTSISTAHGPVTLYSRTEETTAGITYYSCQYFGGKTGLFVLPGETQTTAPNGLITLNRKYGLANSSSGAPPSTIGILTLFTSTSNISEGITIFDCNYYGKDTSKTLTKFGKEIRSYSYTATGSTDVYTGRYLAAIRTASYAVAVGAGTITAPSSLDSPVMLESYKNGRPATAPSAALGTLSITLAAFSTENYGAVDVVTVSHVYAGTTG